LTLQFLTRVLTIARRNIISLLALFFAIGAGGGYALAAARTRTIHGCVNRRTHALYIQKRCQRGQSRIAWNQAGPQGEPGTPAKRAFDVVNYDGTLGLIGSQGISAQHVGTGIYQVTITAAACANSRSVPTITVTQAGSPSVVPPPSGAVPVGWIADTATDQQFTVHTGFLSGGAFSAADLRFDVADNCQ
jgi:hypothetical protein